jgi:hypothetical protein
VTTAITTRTSAPVGEILPPATRKERYARPVSMMPTFEMESRGYQVHQQQCLHRHRCYYYRQWTCADCRERL